MFYNVFMDKAKLKKIENYLFWHCKRRFDAASAMSSIIGVIIGLKPSCCCIFSEENLCRFDLMRFIKLLEKLDLKLAFERKLLESEYYLDLYISKSSKKAERLKELFSDLSKYAYGEGDRKEINAEIGKLLGYPQTAIDYYVRHTESGTLSESHKERIKKYFYYAHSDKHQDEEFKKYDERLNRAIEKYSPRSAKAMRKKYPNKRWLD
jgi:hypothetical protein